MSDERTLPIGWAKVPFGELLREPLRNGHSAKASDNGSGVPTLTLSAVTYDKFTPENVKLTVADPAKVQDLWLEPDDVLIERSNTPELVGTSALFRGPRGFAIFPDLMIRARLRFEVNHRYVAAFLKSGDARQHFRRRAQGIAGSMPKIDQGTVEALPVPLAPREEQDRIVAVIEQHLSDIDAGVAALQRVQRNLKRYRASVLKAAVEGRLVPTEAELARAEKRDYEPASELLKRILVERRRRWEEAELAKMKASGKTPKDDKWKAKYEEPAPADTSKLPKLPEGWCWANPAQFFTWSSGEFLPKNKQHGGNIPVYGGNGVNGWHDRPLINNPTLVIGRVGAQCGNIHLTDRPSWITDNAIYANGGTDRACLAYWRLILSLQSLNAAAGGTGQPYVNQKHLNSLVVPLAPDAEQRRIAEAADDKLSLINHLELEILRAVQRSTRLRQSILKWAFEGKLVDQDPNDEPASVLLDRIRAERAAPQSNTSAKKPRRTSRNA